jgi:uridine kinase
MTTVIAIDGVDGSGKSTFADQLAAALEREGWGTVRFSVDDFRRPVDWTRDDVSEAEIYYGDYYDLALLDGCVRAFQAGAPRVTIPLYDARTDRLEGTRDLVIDGAPIAIVEGVFALRVPAVAGGLLIYMDVATDEASRRLIERDLLRGRSRETIEHRLMKRYQPAQERYQRRFDPARRADVVIDNRGPNPPRSIRRQLSRLPPALTAVLDRVLPALAPPRPPAL